MADEFHFRTVDARRSIDQIQDELRKQVAAFLEPADKPAEAVARLIQATAALDTADGFRSMHAVATVVVVSVAALSPVLHRRTAATTAPNICAIPEPETSGHAPMLARSRLIAA
jgi:hypothetical protein